MFSWFLLLLLLLLLLHSVAVSLLYVAFVVLTFVAYCCFVGAAFVVSVS